MLLIRVGSIRSHTVATAVKNAAHKPFRICVERNKGYNFEYSIDIFADENKKEENYAVIERLIKTILWVAGGYKIYLSGDDYVYERIAADYTANGARAFDVKFMSGVYETPFEVINVRDGRFPEPKSCSLKVTVKMFSSMPSITNSRLLFMWLTSFISIFPYDLPLG